jgi:hypothetical protein
MMMDYDECGAIVGMTGRGEKITRRKLDPLKLCSPQILYDLA